QGEDHPSKTGAATLDLTDETSFSRVYQLTAPESLEEGRPVYAMKTSEGLVTPTNKDTRDWTEIELGGPRRSDKIFCELRPIRPDEKTVDVSQATKLSRHVLRGFFRGQLFTVDTQVTLHLLPDLVSVRNPSSDGAVRIQSSHDQQKLRNVELRIVLDASGSMCSPHKEGTGFDPNATPRRFDRALDALQRALKSLP